MYGVNLWSPILPSSLSSCQNDVPSPVITSVEDSFPKYSPFVISPPMVTATSAIGSHIVSDAVAAATSTSRPSIFGQNFAVGISQPLLCGIPFPSATATRDSCLSSLRQKDDVRSGAFTMLATTSASEERLLSREQENNNCEVSECPICHEALENSNMCLHLLEELEEISTKDPKVATGATGSAEDTTIENEDIQSSSSKSRYEHFLHVRSNRIRRIHVSVNDDDMTETQNTSEGDVNSLQLIKRPRKSTSPSNQTSSFICLKCSSSYVNPLVSVQCWHVLCEHCWIEVLGTKKLCPLCNAVSSPEKLRKIFL